MIDNFEHLDACFAYLKSLNIPDFDEWVEMDEKSAVSNAHFGLGGHIRNHFGLWKKSTVSNWFNSIGIYHADDMSSIILTSLHRKLNGKPFELESQIKHYRDYWDKNSPNVNKGIFK